MTDESAGKAPANYQPENIEGKAAIVTGGTTGIGRATARLLAARGARVLIFGRDEEHLQDALREIQGGGEVHGLTADQSRVEDVQRVLREADERLGSVDILINNAALGVGSILQSDYQELQYALDTNLLGYLACCREAIDRMQQKGAGHIINIGSMSAKVRGENSDLYVATKSAIRGFSDSLAKAVNPGGIKVTLIEPGEVSTPMTDSPDKDQAKDEENLESLQAQDIAECVHYCLTQPARCDVVFVQIRPHLQII